MTIPFLYKYICIFKYSCSRNILSRYIDLYFFLTISLLVLTFLVQILNFLYNTIYSIIFNEIANQTIRSLHISFQNFVSRSSLSLHCSEFTTLIKFMSIPFPQTYSYFRRSKQFYTFSMRFINICSGDF